MKEKTSSVPKKAVPKQRKNLRPAAASSAPVNQGRHEAKCTICKHLQREEIEQEFLNWKSPEKIGEAFGLSRDSIYRHARALDLLEPRRRNVRRALEQIIERAGDVEVNANAIVSAVATYAKLNASGQLIDRVENVNLNELFSRMTEEEMRRYATRGDLPEWFTAVATPNDSREAEMQGKPLNPNRIRLAQIATGMSPADHPLGSLESRSVARALLDHCTRTKSLASEYDEGALTIYRCARLFLQGDGWSGESPILSEVEKTPVYQRGRQLADVAPAHEPRENPVAFIEELFERCGIETPPREAEWREPFLWCTVHAVLLQDFKAAWERQLANLPFPIKTEIKEDWEAQLYSRNAAGEWTEEIDDRKCSRILGPVKELRTLQFGKEIAN